VTSQEVGLHESLIFQDVKESKSQYSETILLRIRIKKRLSNKGSLFFNLDKHIKLWAFY